MKPLSKDLKHKKLEALYSKLADVKLDKIRAQDDLDECNEEIRELENQIEDLENGEEDDEC